VPRFVFISSCAVHDVIRDDRLLDEKHPFWPMSHCGAHKAALEKFVPAYLAHFEESFHDFSMFPAGDPQKTLEIV
jgi:hypothetical protein